jgi:hypothetical protein
MSSLKHPVIEFKNSILCTKWTNILNLLWQSSSYNQKKIYFSSPLTTRACSYTIQKKNPIGSRCASAFVYQVRNASVTRAPACTVSSFRTHLRRNFVTSYLRCVRCFLVMSLPKACRCLATFSREASRSHGMIF